jgi:phenylalanine-4-hydroxylase
MTKMKQQYELYTAENHLVWSILFGKQMVNLKGRANAAYLAGIELAGFEPDRIPKFSEVNERLAKLTGWCIYEVPGIVADDHFFELLAEKKFPATTWIRKMSELEYLEEPDMFHDVFGHVPLLVNQPYVDFLQGISRIALKHIKNPWAVELMSRLYWFTIEFGLIKEQDHTEIYGAGILSSIGESVYSLESTVPARKPFDIQAIFDSPYVKEKFQVEYYIIESFEQLYHSVDAIEAQLELALAKVGQ